MSHKNEINIGSYNKEIIVTVYKCSSTVSDIFWVRIMTYTTSSFFTSIPWQVYPLGFSPLPNTQSASLGRHPQ